MAEALTAIHAAGVVHRDLKPGNVMLTDDRPIVIDFGIAQAGDATRLTQTGLVMGTPGYLAPEVIEGEPSSPASDVHSWGSTMAFAATGHLPFGGGSYETIFYRIISGRADLSGVPAPLVPLISAALARDPSHRPSASWLSAQAVALDMSATTAPPPTTAFRSPRPSIPARRRSSAVPARRPQAAAAGPRHGAPLPRPSRRPGMSPTCCRRSATRRPGTAEAAVPGPGRPVGPAGPQARRACRRPRCRPLAAPPRAPPPGRTPPPASPSWSRWWR